MQCVLSATARTAMALRVWMTESDLTELCDLILVLGTGCFLIDESCQQKFSLYLYCHLMLSYIGFTSNYTGYFVVIITVKNP